ncbi:PAS domain-containing sensor histidine kinase [Amycolatopsis antarctica]|uniref:histidine kinase n=1 Tax=Amycolatopsis antarctica TaxID=1854586 RepID=A0A263D4T5_9PSEU|nr:PAS domain S-box protein [Amycolatopsis antarctica]OZM72486.1 PAS domain-containing sensor histidine kinase [Amycolatopsis antarctica]
MPELGLADYRELVQALEYCVLLHDAKTKNIIWANKAACELLGFTVDELKPLKAPDMSSNAEQYRREIGVGWLQRAVDHGISATEWCYRSKSGEEILTEAIAIRVDLRSRPIVMVQFRDIVEEKAVQHDLVRTEGRLTAFLRNLAEGIVVLDEDGFVAFASESAAKLLELDVTDLTGADFRGFCAGDSREALRLMMATASPDAPPQDARYRLRTAEGTLRWFSGSCQYIEIESDLRGHLLLLHDISDRVRAEEEHRRDLQNLEYLARYNAMGDMAMAIAHEVSQPLAAAYNFLEGVRGRLGPALEANEPAAWGLDNAKLQIERASQILRSLRRYVVRLEQSEQSTDLNGIVEDCLYFVDLRAKSHGVELVLDLTAEALPVRCEKVLIGQVVINLAFNAIDEMARWPEGSRRVEIGTRRVRDGAELAVSDRGQGISGIPEGRIFDGVFTSKEDGNGIGLALSHRIVSRHRGRIDAAENPPRGAVFTFALPLDPGAGGDPAPE